MHNDFRVLGYRIETGGYRRPYFGIRNTGMLQIQILVDGRLWWVGAEGDTLVPPNREVSYRLDTAG